MVFDSAPYQGVILCTGCVIYQKYMYMLLGANKEAIPGKAYSKWADRAFGNYNEQFALFTISLWAHALFVNPDHAAIFGFVYVFLRFAYIIIWLFDSDASKPKPDALPLATVPMYGVITWLMLTTVLKTCNHWDFAHAITFAGTAQMVPTGIIIGTAFFMVIGSLAGCMAPFFKADEE